jgi:hypothetical protein
MPCEVTCASCKRRLSIPDNVEDDRLTCPVCLGEVVHPARRSSTAVQTTSAGMISTSIATGPTATPIEQRRASVDADVRRDAQASGWALIVFALLGGAALLPIAFFFVIGIGAPTTGFLGVYPRNLALLGAFLLAAVLTLIGVIAVSRQKRQGETSSAGTTVARTLAFWGFVLWSVGGVCGIVTLFLFGIEFGGMELAISLFWSAVILVVWFKLGESYLKERFPRWMHPNFFLRLLMFSGFALVAGFALGVLVFATCFGSLYVSRPAGF